MKIIIDIPSSLYSNLQKITFPSTASKRILECVKNGKTFDELIDQVKNIETGGDAWELSLKDEILDIIVKHAN